MRNFVVGVVCMSLVASVADARIVKMGYYDGRDQFVETAGQIRNALGLRNLPVNRALRSVKIAIIDKGFRGYDSTVGYLPTSVRTVEGRTVETYPEDFLRNYTVQGLSLGALNYFRGFADTIHGRTMTQIIWAMTSNWGGNARSETYRNNNAPIFYLLNGSTFTNVKRAIAMAIRERVHFILYSQGWFTGGNFDGRGYINDAFNKATDRGIIVVVAAGNNHGFVYNGRVNAVTDSNHRGLCLESKANANSAKITLSWEGDHWAREAIKTNKDLALVVEDADGEEVARADVRQSAAEDAPFRGAFEELSYRFSRNDANECYRIFVEKKGGTFRYNDQLRITINPENGQMFDFKDASNEKELPIPADNPNVITIGDANLPGSRNPPNVSSLGPTMDPDFTGAKPNRRTQGSRADFDDRSSSSGTSNSAAYAVGVFAMLKAHEPRNNPLTRHNAIARWAAISGDARSNRNSTSSNSGSNSNSTTTTVPGTQLTQNSQNTNTNGGAANTGNSGLGGQAGGTTTGGTNSVGTGGVARTTTTTGAVATTTTGGTRVVTNPVVRTNTTTVTQTTGGTVVRQPAVIVVEYGYSSSGFGPVFPPPPPIFTPPIRRPVPVPYLP